MEKRNADNTIVHPSPAAAVPQSTAAVVYPIVYFVTGGGMTDAEQAALAQQIVTYYTSRISMGIIIVCKYTDDIPAIMQANSPAGPLILAGHSFGGWSAIAAAQIMAQRGRTIASLMLCDPVNSGPNQYLIPQPPVTAPPSLNAICFYRGATAPPYSTFLTGPGHYSNVLIPPSGGGGPDHHPDSVWDAQALAFISHAVQFVPTVPGWKSVTVTDLDGRQWIMPHPATP